MDQSTLMLLGIALTVALAVGGVAFAFLGSGSDKANKRVAAVSRGTGRASVAKGAEAVGESNAKRRKQVQETLKEIERKQEAVKQRPTLGAMLDQADWNIDARMFHMITGGVALVTVCAFLFFGYAWYVAIGIGFAVGLGLPRWLLGFTINRRKKAFSKEFANAIDVIVRGVKAGLPLNECLKIIANETAEPVGPEFRQIVEGLKVGVTLEDGLKRMYDRMPIAEVNFFQIVLTIQQKTGGNLSEALGNLSSVLRDRKRLHGKIQALSSEAKASAGIIGSLPMVVMGLVYFTTPEYIALLFTERFGNFLLLCCAGWMSVGIFVMKKMIDFKY
ncbi:MAG: type II secretion system F family protein [Alphaproteobacteria bacterium]|nr:type II secretion system F family protein [Alphaproteobacteria bacterium]